MDVNLSNPGFPLCGYTSDNTAKFKKWKVELLWYEGPKSTHARIYCESAEVAEVVALKVRENRLKYILFYLALREHTSKIQRETHM